MVAPHGAPVLRKGRKLPWEQGKNCCATESITRGKEFFPDRPKWLPSTELIPDKEGRLQDPERWQAAVTICHCQALLLASVTQDLVWWYFTPRERDGSDIQGPSGEVAVTESARITWQLLKQAHQLPLFSQPHAASQWPASLRRTQKPNSFHISSLREADSNPLQCLWGSSGSTQCLLTPILAC